MMVYYDVGDWEKVQASFFFFLEQKEYKISFTFSQVWTDLNFSNSLMCVVILYSQEKLAIQFATYKFNWAK